MLKIGLDVGSTTLKCVVLNDERELLYQSYERHFSKIGEKTVELLRQVAEKCGVKRAQVCISGSAGLGLAESCGIPFAQEVYATRTAVRTYLPSTDVVIELGGEDAKILFLTGGMEVRMNGSCAGGTGAFIDQMATLLGVSAEELNHLAEGSERLYTIASRCGVFAKSDVQPLLNQGARREDVAASIFYAIVNQTLAGLAQGRPIEGNVAYLGGPLTFLPQLRKSFDETLHTEGLCPENSLYFVALGAALDPQEAEFDLEELIGRIGDSAAKGGYRACGVLFDNEEALAAFQARHARAVAPRGAWTGGPQKVYLGIDAGSTTIKAVVIDEQDRLLSSVYLPNAGDPIPILRDFLLKLRREHPQAEVAGAAVTGYGEDLIRQAFNLDFGLVETMAHFAAARHFQPQVDFIIDIGGQDIKCFKIRNGAIDNLFLNEACSSGCGSFLQTFAGALGYAMEDFAKLGLLARRPVDLGSRCTVFMNSSVKQAQKDGATLEDISAGLSISVVKNALYKVIRAPSGDALGEHIVVQGGTFLNDAVLRAFEQEIGREVVRPDIAGLMGAFGAALHAQEKSGGKSTLLSLEELENFTQQVRQTVCGLCGNHCRLSVNTFSGGRRFIAGNRCQRPIKQKKAEELYDLYEFKRRLLEEYKPKPGPRGKLGLPMALSNFELLPFWYTMFTELGFEVITSPQSSRTLYLNGQSTIPSDTVCFPAKLVHGHIQALLDQGVDVIFYPCLTYNFDEGLGDNHFNCPVVAYYPEVIDANMPGIKNVTFIHDYLGIHRPRDFKKRLHVLLSRYFGPIRKREIDQAVDRAYAAQGEYRKKVVEGGQMLLDIAEREKLPVIVLVGRPYHVDPEICHEIDKLICSFGAVVVTEDAVSPYMKRRRTEVLNQWTYHARLYAAAEYVGTQPNMNLVQLVSFGCGVDAITTDEVREILERHGKIYTQLKIDEITNLGAVKIRLRSLFAAAGLEE